MDRGIFIALEGPDGSGKSTALKAIEDYYTKLGINYESTREPGGTRFGEKLRTIILNPESGMCAEAEALLFAAQRAQHVKERILPSLEKGYMVLCDRFILSSMAYQGFGRDLGIELVQSINEFASSRLYPDLTLFFDIDPEITLSRKLESGYDRLELEGEAFHTKVYRGYIEAIKTYKGKLVKIDATLDKNLVAQAAIDEIDKIRRALK